MKKIVSGSLSDKTKQELLNSDEFVKKVCNYLNISEQTFNEFSWHIHEDKYRGFYLMSFLNTHLSKSKREKLNKHEFHANRTKIYLTDLYESIFDSEFLDLLSNNLESSWFLIKSKESRITVRSDFGLLLDWHAYDEPHIYGSFKKIENEIRNRARDKDFGMYDLTDYLIEYSMNKGYGFKMSERYF